MTWTRGATHVKELIEKGELEQVEPSLDVARRLLDDADHHEASAELLAFYARE